MIKHHPSVIHGRKNEIFINWGLLTIQGGAAYNISLENMSSQICTYKADADEEAGGEGVVRENQLLGRGCLNI